MRTRNSYRNGGIDARYPQSCSFPNNLPNGVALPPYCNPCIWKVSQKCRVNHGLKQTWDDRWLAFYRCRSCSFQRADVSFT